MSDFTPIQGRLLLVTGGVYKNADLYERDGRIFAKHGQGFIAIKANGDTSKNRVFWKDIELNVSTHNHIGNLVLSNQPRAIAAE